MYMLVRYVQFCPISLLSSGVPVENKWIPLCLYHSVLSSFFVINWGSSGKTNEYPFVCTVHQFDAFGAASQEVSFGASWNFLSGCNDFNVAWIRKEMYAWPTNRLTTPKHYVTESLRHCIVIYSTHLGVNPVLVNIRIYSTNYSMLVNYMMGKGPKKEWHKYSRK